MTGKKQNQSKGKKKQQKKKIEEEKNIEKETVMHNQIQLNEEKKQNDVQQKESADLEKQGALETQIGSNQFESQPKLEEEKFQIPIINDQDDQTQSLITSVEQQQANFQQQKIQEEDEIKQLEAQSEAIINVIEVPVEIEDKSKNEEEQEQEQAFLQKQQTNLEQQKIQQEDVIRQVDDQDETRVNVTEGQVEKKDNIKNKDQQVEEQSFSQIQQENLEQQKFQQENEFKQKEEQDKNEDNIKIEYQQEKQVQEQPVPQLLFEENINQKDVLKEENNEAKIVEKKIQEQEQDQIVLKNLECTENQQQKIMVIEKEQNFNQEKGIKHDLLIEGYQVIKDQSILNDDEIILMNQLILSMEDRIKLFQNQMTKIQQHISQQKIMTPAHYESIQKCINLLHPNYFFNSKELLLQSMNLLKDTYLTIANYQKKQKEYIQCLQTVDGIFDLENDNIEAFILKYKCLRKIDRIPESIQILKIAFEISKSLKVNNEKTDKINKDYDKFVIKRLGQDEEMIAKAKEIRFHRLFHGLALSVIYGVFGVIMKAFADRWSNKYMIVTGGLGAILGFWHGYNSAVR